jgi:hypothetical protein
VSALYVGWLVLAGVRLPPICSVPQRFEVWLVPVAASIIIGLDVLVAGTIGT